MEKFLEQCFVCGNSNFSLLKLISQKPKNETYFGFDKNRYKREIKKCDHCLVYNNFHNMDLDDLYNYKYNANTYKGNIIFHFNKIMKLPYEESDNKNRVKRIIDYFREKSVALERISLLDVGSGLCVFPAEAIKHFATVSCIDVDQITIDHAKNNVGVHEAIKGNFKDIELNKKYDLITFNKVLEHIPDPSDLLIKARDLLTENGIIYIELPDGETSSEQGGFLDREEFFIEHYTIFNIPSVKFLAKSAKLSCVVLNAIHEPSDKYTIYSFMEKDATYGIKK